MPALDRTYRARRRRRCGAPFGLLAAGAVATLAWVAPAQAASVQNVGPASGTAMTEGDVTVHWKLDVAGCDPLKAAVTSVEVEADGLVMVADGTLPAPAATGIDAGLFAAAAADGLRFAFRAVALKIDAPSDYRWRARLRCTGPGLPPDPVAQIDVRSEWSSLRVSRPTATPAIAPAAPAAAAPAAVPKPRIGKPIGPRRARIAGFLGWSARNRLIPAPFAAHQIPRPLVKPGGTIGNCTRGPQGLLIILRYSGIPRPRPITWIWTLDGKRLAAGRSVIGGQDLYQLWMGHRDRALPNGVYTVNLRLGKRLFGTASVRRAC